MPRGIRRAADEALLITATGSTADRALADRFADFPVVEDWRRTTTGALRSDTETIQAAIDALGAGDGGTLRLLNETYEVDELSQTYPHVRLIGGGSDFYAAGTTHTPPTVLKYIGESGGTVLTVSSVSGASNLKNTDCDVIGISIDGNSLADYGLYVASVNKSEFDVSVKGCSTAQVVSTTIASLADARDPQHNYFRYLRLYATGSAHGLLLTTPAVGANTSLNRFGRVYVYHDDGDGVRIENGDNNQFESITAERAGGGTGVGLRLCAGDGSATAGAYSNIIYHFSGLGGCTAEGTETDTNESTNNIVAVMDRANGTPEPTIGTDATLMWGDNYGVHLVNSRQVQAVFANTTTGVRAAAANLGTEALRISHSSSNHVRLENGTEEWAIDIDGSTGNLRLRRISGTGHIAYDTNIRTTGNFRQGSGTGQQVVAARKVGWGAPTGTATRTTFATSTVTTEQLAERVKALIDDLNAATGGHGLIGP